jgi:uncharacterized protein (TIGR02246 family)
MNEIDALYQAWKDAVRRGDIDTLLTFITEDAEFWPRDTPAIRGKENIRNLYASFFANFSLEQHFEETERIVEGGFAFVRGLEVNTLTPRTGGASTEVRQRAFSILRLDADGKWRFSRGMTNVDTRAAARV